VLALAMMNIAGAVTEITDGGGYYLICFVPVFDDHIAITKDTISSIFIKELFAIWLYSIYHVALLMDYELHTR
jgi:hypothetical protein